jgi:phosphorylcholine metabolism protein LicD
LKYLVKILNDNKIDYIITCGTLLGYYRHNNGFIPWDDDIDICIVEKDLDKLKQIMNEVVKSTNYLFDNSLYGKNTFYTFSLLKYEIFIDIFVMNNNKDENKYTYNDKVEKIFPDEFFMKDELYPLQDGNFILYLPDGNIYEKLPIKLPNKPLAFLKRTYSDWETKKVYSPHCIYNMFLYNKIIPSEFFKKIFKNVMKKKNYE